MLICALYLVTALAAALMAGFFWSFSAVVMDDLRLLPPQEGMRAMQRRCPGGFAAVVGVLQLPVRRTVA